MISIIEYLYEATAYKRWIESNLKKAESGDLEALKKVQDFGEKYGLLRAVYDPNYQGRTHWTEVPAISRKSSPEDIRREMASEGGAFRKNFTDPDKEEKQIAKVKASKSNRFFMEKVAEAYRFMPRESRTFNPKQLKRFLDVGRKYVGEFPTSYRNIRNQGVGPVGKLPR